MIIIKVERGEKKLKPELLLNNVPFSAILTTKYQNIEKN